MLKIDASRSDLVEEVRRSSVEPRSTLSCYDSWG
jgi:hypothetical protein